MSRYYIRMIHSDFLMRKGASGPRWVKHLDEATGFLSYGEAQCHALELKRDGYVVSAVSQAEAVLALTRMQEAV